MVIKDPHSEEHDCSHYFQHGNDMLLQYRLLFSEVDITDDVVFTAIPRLFSSDTSAFISSFGGTLLAVIPSTGLRNLHRFPYGQVASQTATSSSLSPRHQVRSSSTSFSAVSGLACPRRLLVPDGGVNDRRTPFASRRLYNIASHSRRITGIFPPIITFCDDVRHDDLAATFITRSWVARDIARVIPMGRGTPSDILFCDDTA